MQEAKPVDLTTQEEIEDENIRLIKEEWEFVELGVDEFDGGIIHELPAEVSECMKSSRCVQTLYNHAEIIQSLCRSDIFMDKKLNALDRSKTENTVVSVEIENRNAIDNSICENQLVVRSGPISKFEMLYKLEQMKLDLIKGLEEESGIEKEAFSQLKVVFEQIDLIQKQILSQDRGLSDSLNEWEEVNSPSSLQYQIHKLREVYYFSACSIGKLFEPLQPAVSGIHALFLLYNHRALVVSTIWWMARLFLVSSVFLGI